jgi:hypothetical protein
MAKERKIALVVNKLSFAEADEQEIFQWEHVPFEEKWQSLERLRRTFYSLHEIPFPERMERVIIKIKNGAGF